VLAVSFWFWLSIFVTVWLVCVVVILSLVAAGGREDDRRERARKRRWERMNGRGR